MSTGSGPSRIMLKPLGARAIFARGPGWPRRLRVVDAVDDARQQRADRQDDGADEQQALRSDASSRKPARTDPTHAPRLLPTPMSGNRRLPCSWV